MSPSPSKVATNAWDTGVVDDIIHLEGALDVGYNRMRRAAGQGELYLLSA